jgi:1-deoxy-D-xylulose-5-phosphate reductoisomerase
MRLPIQYAVTYPERFKTRLKILNFSTMKNLSFEKPDLDRFPCLGLARLAVKKGGAYPAVLNAADEEAVKNYLGGKIKFSRIPYIIESVLTRCNGRMEKEPSLDDIIDAEIWAREEALRLCH